MKEIMEKLSSPRIDKELLEQLAEEASAAYLQDQVPLEDSIVKMSQARDMNPHQVQRLCEFANLKTFQTLYKTSSDKSFEFDVADIKKILSESQIL